jgi:malate permease and related proteins
MVVSVLLGIFELFILFGIGYLARRLKFLDNQVIGSMSKVLLDLLIPLLVFQSIVRNLDVSRLGELWPLPLIGFGLMALGGGLSFLLEKGLRTEDAEVKKTFRHLCAINNYVFLPLILINRIIGERGVALLFLLSVGSVIGLWTIGIALLGKGGSFREVLKQIMTPVLGAIILALVLSVLRLGDDIPLFFLDLFEKIGNAGVQMILILIGASWSRLSFKEGVWNQVYMALVRLVVIPGVSVLLLVLFNLPRDIFLVSFIVAVMPVSSQSSLITRRYGGSPEFASKAIIVTTLVSAVTIPLWVVLVL